MVFAPYQLEILDKGFTGPDSSMRVIETESQAFVSVEHTGAFEIQLKGALDLTGFEGIELAIDSEGGELTFEITDCLGNAWTNSRAFSAGNQLARFPIEGFKPMGEVSEGARGPVSLGRARLRFKPMKSGREQQFLWRQFALFYSKGLFGPTMSIDPAFEAYRKTPWRETARRLRGDGVTNALIVFTREIEPARHREMLEGLHAEGLATTLRINPPTDFEAYEEHPEWRQRMIDGSGQFDWRVYLCPNNTAFADHYTSRVAGLVRDYPYDALLISELWFEVWGGAFRNNPTRGKYACLCDHCVAKFQAQHGFDPRELFDEESDRYFESFENYKDYEKWVEFRVASINEFAGKLAAAAREAKPSVKIGYMYLSDVTVEPGRTREYQAQDLEGAIRAANADFVVIQDSWQDWTKPELAPDEFVQEYAEAYIGAVHKVKPGIPVLIHADVGSLPAMRRSGMWMRRTAGEAQRHGFAGVVYYEFTLNRELR